MLVLSRKKDERIYIGEEITVTVLEISDGKVRLGIIAPKEVAVHREEVWRKIHDQSDQSAVNGTPGTGT